MTLKVRILDSGQTELEDTENKPSLSDPPSPNLQPPFIPARRIWIRSFWGVGMEKRRKGEREETLIH